MKIAIIDLGVGNLRSVKQALATVAPDADVVLSHNADEILRADKIVLPGQGAVGTWFKELHARGLQEALDVCLAEKPLLGDLCRHASVVRTLRRRRWPIRPRAISR